MTIENILESIFGDSRLTQFYRTELKTRRQTTGENLQALAADVERLMNMAYIECPLDVLESLAAQYFVDAIKEEDMQQSTRLMYAKDLNSALAYSMKYEAARTVSKTHRHVRSMEIELEKLFNISVAGKKNTPRQNPKLTCWKCKKKGHVQRLLGDYFQPDKLTYDRLTGRKLRFLNKTSEEGLKVYSLSGYKNRLYVERSICGTPCLMSVDTGANVTLLPTDLAQKSKKQLIYTAPNISFKTTTAEQKYAANCMHPLNVDQENFILEFTD
ncbi:hypothetical protein AVEN_4575-1 [Araneus ventricosus]|uniref:Peptidase A2 domain-containing protein n=1 Tax=Araneus ventricosus TaxID=182803 RepID=A0A4Y2SJU8_ARAVE|nr:hypothetical protein AVEN_4575-1 [Araneus ventricosus]